MAERELDGVAALRSAAPAVHKGAAPIPRSNAVTPRKSNIASPLRWLTRTTPTNWNMLTFRTLNGHMGRPNANDDHLAPLLRDKLMPVRSAVLTRVPGAAARFRSLLEHPRHGAPGVINFVDARTKWFDTAVAEAIAHRHITQVVVVAAGFDTRAYRFAHPRVAFFEVDLPKASRKKQRLMQELARSGAATGAAPTYVAADLATTPLSQALQATAFNPSLPTLFTLEGLIYYLPPAAVESLFADVACLSAPGSSVLFDYLHEEDRLGSCPPKPGYTTTARSVANKGEPFLSGIPSGAVGLAAFVASIPSSAPDGPAGAGVSGSASAASRATALPFRVVGHWGPREMLEAQLPHEKWPRGSSSEPPPILGFYSFAALERA